MSEPTRAWRKRHDDTVREFGLLWQAIETSPDDLHVEHRLRTLVDEIDDVEMLRTLLCWFAYHFHFKDVDEDGEP
jgi:hypothetical protein